MLWAPTRKGRTLHQPRDPDGLVNGTDTAATCRSQGAPVDLVLFFPHWPGPRLEDRDELLIGHKAPPERPWEIPEGPLDGYQLGQRRRALAEWTEIGHLLFEYERLPHSTPGLDVLATWVRWWDASYWSRIPDPGVTDLGRILDGGLAAEVAHLFPAVTMAAAAGIRTVCHRCLGGHGGALSTS